MLFNPQSQDIHHYNKCLILYLILPVPTKKGVELTVQPFFPGQNFQEVSFSWLKPCLSWQLLLLLPPSSLSPVNKTPSCRYDIYGYFLEDFETDVMCSVLQTSFISNCYVKCSFFEDHVLGMLMVEEQKTKAISMFYRRGSWSGTGEFLTSSSQV